MVAGALAVDLIEKSFAFTPQQSFPINSGDHQELTEKYFDDLIAQIENKIPGDIGRTVVIAPPTLPENLKTYFGAKLDEIGIMPPTFIRSETLYLIGGLKASKITVAKNETIAIFYSNNSNFIGDQWKKNATDKLIFEKRIYFSTNEGGLKKVFSSKIPNHILISDKIVEPEKHFPNINFEIFRENGNTFLLSAALTKAGILMKDEGLKGFDAEDIGNIQIKIPKVVTKVANVIGISIGSDIFSIAKYANEKIEVIKNAKNEETMKSVVFWKDGKLFVDGNQEGARALEYCIDLLGEERKEEKEPFTKIFPLLAENEEAPNTKVCYNFNGKIVNPERVALELLTYIKTISGGNQNDAKIVFALSTKIKNTPKKLQVFHRLAKEAGLEASGIVENNLGLCLGGSQNKAKVDTVGYRFVQNQIYDFEEASKDFPQTNSDNNEFALREHLLIITKAAFDVLKKLNIDQTDIDVVLLNYNGKFKETTKEFLQRMFLEKQIIELQSSHTVTALGAAIYGAIENV
uniref:Uncharacterized protein n=1 Tax=Panagrolaimus superbus TaxID=310955 RepID=A0A914YC34_9BILA